MPGDLERLPASGAGPAVLAAELLGRVRTELPVIGEMGEREQVLVAAWLTGLRSARTRRAYAADVAAWLGWLAERDASALAAGRVHVDLWAATQLDDGAAASSVRRRLSALYSFYRYCAAHDLIGRIPTQGVARPVVDHRVGRMGPFRADIEGVRFGWGHFGRPSGVNWIRPTHAATRSLQRPLQLPSTGWPGSVMVGGEPEISVMGQITAM